MNNIFPIQTHNGMMGLGLGTLTPLLVVLYNAVRGFAAALWLEMTR